MATTDTTVTTRAIPDVLRIEWGPVIAGTITAAAVASVLHGLATAVGISVSSTAPTWRDASFALILLSGLYLLIAGVIAYGLGGYIAGRVRTRFATWDGTEATYSDGLHGLLVWALATLLTAVLAFAAATAATRLAAPSGTAAQSVAGENIIAMDIDRLFRGHRPEVDMTLARAEAARILLTASSHRGVLPDDRTALTRLVEQNAGADAGRRVDQAIASAKDNIDRARRSAAILAFMAAAVAALGAAIAWFAAEAAGRHRQGLDTIPTWLDWGATTYPHRRPLP